MEGNPFGSLPPDSPLSPSPPSYRAGYYPGKLRASRYKQVLVLKTHFVGNAWTRVDSEDNSTAYLLPSEVPSLDDHSPLEGPKEKMAYKNPFKCEPLLHYFIVVCTEL